MKNSIAGLDIRIKQAEKGISVPEVGQLKFFNLRGKKKQSLRDLLGTTSHRHRRRGKKEQGKKHIWRNNIRMLPKLHKKKKT